MIALKKRYLLLKICVVVAVLFTSIQLYAVQGPQNVTNTAHNLGYSAGNPRGFSSDDPDFGPGTTEVCIFCHTPHNAGSAIPLWNQYSSATSKAFLMYTSSSTLTAAAKANPGLSADSTSRLCLTCHDGVTAMNALINTGTKLAGVRPDFVLLDTSFEMTGVYGTIAGGDTEGPHLGTNLTNMHPINFSYSLAAGEDTDLEDIGIVENDLKFYGATDYLECATCHDPHVDYGYYSPGAPSGTGDLRYKPFLRKPNTSSGLCLTCHNK